MLNLVRTSRNVKHYASLLQISFNLQKLNGYFLLQHVLNDTKSCLPILNSNRANFTLSRPKSH